MRTFLEKHSDPIFSLCYVNHVYMVDGVRTGLILITVSYNLCKIHCDIVQESKDIKGSWVPQLSTEEFTKSKLLANIIVIRNIYETA